MRISITDIVVFAPIIIFIILGALAAPPIPAENIDSLPIFSDVASGGMYDEESLPDPDDGVEEEHENILGQFISLLVLVAATWLVVWFFLDVIVGEGDDNKHKEE